MNDAVPPSAGKTFAISAGTSNASVVVLIYTCHVWGLDMPPEVAGALITLAMGLTGLLMHLQQRKNEAVNALQVAVAAVQPNPAPAPAA